MRALNSRRPRPTSVFHLANRSFVVLLLPLLLVHGARARHLPSDEAVQVDRIEDKISAVVDEKADGARTGDSVEGERAKELTSVHQEPGSADDAVIGHDSQDSQALKQEDDEGSVAKKRRRNDVALSGKSDFQSSDEAVGQDQGQSVQHEGQGAVHVVSEGIRRFDAQVASDNGERGKGKVIADDPAVNASDSGSVRNGEPEKLTPSAGHQERLINQNGDSKSEDEAMQELERKISKESETKAGNATGGPVRLDEAEQPKIDEVKVEDPYNDLRSLESGQKPTEDKEPEGVVSAEGASPKEIKETPLNREDRHLEAQRKSKFKSSTVYLNAEEGRSPDGVPDSVVDGQIKKLISIRDGALGSVSNPVGDSGDLDEAKLLASRKSIGIEDEVGPEDESDDVRNQRSDSNAEAPPGQSESSEQRSNSDRLQKWKDSALLLQSKVRNRPFLQHLKEQAIEVLPDVPKFTENQLLATLKNILSTRQPEALNDPDPILPNSTTLTNRQLEIIRCAAQLVDVRQRDSFVQNMYQCITGLSVLNCMRIFIWPIVVENLPESIGQNFVNLPIEISLTDLFQGNRGKAARAHQATRGWQFLTPEFVVSAILKDALQSYPADAKSPSFIDPKNETLRKLLTPGQVEILQMAEKFLPEALRQEYSDKMFSCVRRFEYFSCMKYFAWPMVKQHFPALPAFPDYLSWYPTATFFPDYPIVPFPSASDDVGELPEVVDSDDPRRRKPRPEAVIVNILQKTLREQSRVPTLPSFVEAPPTGYVTLIPQEQLLSIQMAEQLLPVPYRPEFVQKTMKCIQEFNYYSCIKYSTWPTVKQYAPTLPQLPDFSGWIPDIQIPEWSEIFGVFPGLPSLPDWSGFIPGGGESTQPPPAEPQPPPAEPQPTDMLFRKDSPLRDAGILEDKITDILKQVRNSLKAASDVPPLIIGGNVIILAAITEKQINILRLAESILPPGARAAFMAQALSCLQNGNDFINCTRYIVWPTVALYAPSLPEFPALETEQQANASKNRQESQKQQPASSEASQERVIAKNEQDLNINIVSRSPFVDGPKSRNRIQQSSVPLISVTGTSFVPIFTDHPEVVILNILKSVQLSTPPVVDQPIPTTIRTQQFVGLLSQQQENIVKITESLLPDSVRPDFINRMIACVQNSSFLICSRDVVWPTLTEYFPSLPSFPNFGMLIGALNSNNSAMQPPSQNLSVSTTSTDTPPLSETNVKTGQHGDATVTITDTRFFPIFTDHPEAVILNILKAVQLSTPNLPNPSATSRTQELIEYFTEQQAIIMQSAESLLPESIRPIFVNRMIDCIRDSTFLDCTRNIAWPTIAQFFPRLPNFPNFGSQQNLPRTKPQTAPLLNATDSASRNVTNATQNYSTAKPAPMSIEQMEAEIEAILKRALASDSRPRLEHSYLDVSNPLMPALTSQEAGIIKLAESGMPDPVRPTFVTRMLECVRTDNFVRCTQRISWPTLKQFIPGLPDFPNFGDYLPQLPQLPGQPGFPQLPDFGQLPSIPGIDGSSFAGLPSLPQFPGGIPQFPGGIPQVPGGFPSLPQFGGFSASVKASAVQSETRRPEEAERIDDKLEAATTPSVDDQAAVPGYAGQPSEIHLDVSKEKITSVDDKETKLMPESSELEVPSKESSRKRRSVVDLLKSHPRQDQNQEKIPQPTDSSFPNITESQFLQLLVNVCRSKDLSTTGPSGTSKEYFVDTLNTTTKNSLTADQYEILKLVEDLKGDSSRGFLTRVFQCIRGLSFIRCVGIFVWPMIASNLPSLPEIPGFGILGRSETNTETVTETEVEQFFGMSTAEFEKELLARKEAIENFLISSYKKLMEDKFQKEYGFLKIRGSGNGELSISFAGFREARASKIKDNKNLPSILTIISDIMEEVLDQRPSSDKPKKDKEKKERSIQDNAEYQLLHDRDGNIETSENDEAQRSIDDDQLISMFLEKIRANNSDFTDGDIRQYVTLEDAYNAFAVLFGTRMNGRIASKLKSYEEDRLRSRAEKSPNKRPIKEVDIVPLELQSKNPDDLKVIPLESQVTYDLEKESLEDQREQNRQQRTKNAFRMLLDKYSDKYLQETRVESSSEKRADGTELENGLKSSNRVHQNGRSELTFKLPRLTDAIVPRKVTSALASAGRNMKTKMTQMMPGIGYVVSFLVQMVLAHARAAASMAGMLSNMALGSAIFGMIRQTLFGPSMHPKIKYVYDNDKMGPGISWPSNHMYGPYHGK